MLTMRVRVNQMARTGSALLLAAVIGVASTTTAEAAFVAAICDDAACNGVGDVIVSDGGAGDLDALFGGATAGIIVAGGSVGGYTFSLNTSQTKPVFGSAAQPAINLAYQLTGVGDIWLYAGDTGFTGVGHVSLLVNSTTPPLGSTLPGQITTAYAMGADENVPVSTNGLNLSPVLITIGPIANAFSAAATGGLVGVGVNPYSLAVGVNVSRTATGTSSGDATVSVPEPASVALLGLGLLGAGAAVRRRRQATA